MQKLTSTTNGTNRTKIHNVVNDVYEEISFIELIQKERIILA